MLGVESEEAAMDLLRAALKPGLSLSSELPGQSVTSLLIDYAQDELILQMAVPIIE